ncbi:MAG: hypothetical protein ACTHJS_12055 [Xanthobacteraceae bacterium]
MLQHYVLNKVKMPSEDAAQQRPSLLQIRAANKKGASFEGKFIRRQVAEAAKQVTNTGSNAKKLLGQQRHGASVMPPHRLDPVLTGGPTKKQKHANL